MKARTPTEGGWELVIRSRYVAHSEEGEVKEEQEGQAWHRWCVWGRREEGLPEVQGWVMHGVQCGV